MKKIIMGVIIVGIIIAGIIFAGFLFAGVSAQAADLSKIQTTELKALADNAASQRRINQLDDATAKLVAEYRTVIAQIESLKKYNAQINLLITAQIEEKKDLRQQIKRAGTIDRHIVPLMHKMLNALAQFIQLDVPFLRSERKTRIETLRQLMDRSDAKPAEKFRKILEAYEIEMEYGRTIEAWQDVLPQPIEGKDITVDFMRFGRLSWVYQTFNQSQTALWDQQGRQWLPLYGWSSDMHQAVKVAREQAPPSLLLLPIKERKK